MKLPPDLLHTDSAGRDNHLLIFKYPQNKRTKNSLIVPVVVYLTGNKSAPNTDAVLGSVLTNRNYCVWKVDDSRETKPKYSRKFQLHISKQREKTMTKSQAKGLTKKQTSFSGS